jgi:DNA-directed RNA polymerase subunit omega
MARITIEDCLSQGVMNQFELVLLAAKRARRLANGADALVDWQNDKPTVVALREIADGKVNRDLLLEADPEPAPQMAPQESPLDLPPDFRAPQFGLGD